MDFAVLGPLEVRDDDREIRLGTPKQRVILATLICHANSAVSMDRLVDELWGSKPPKTAQNNLHLYVHQLRRALGEQRIKRLRSGYQLGIGAGELDVDRFADLATRGHLAQSAGEMRRAAKLFEDALALWRGAPYADFDNCPTLSSEAAGLEERRLSVVEERVGVDLALGRHGELVAELSKLVADHPLRERFCAQLMVALFRSGRQAEALEVYRAARCRLADELGLDPGAELKRIHEGILRGALPSEYWPIIEHRRPVVGRIPAQLPPDVADFVGRSQQIKLISSLLEPPKPRALPVVAIAGMGGIGKTALATHVAHLLVPAFPDGQLYANLRGIESSPVEPVAVLGRFLRAFGVPPEAIPDDPSERMDVYRSRLAGRRVLIMLDNAAKEAQVRPLLPGSPTCAVLITSRASLTGLEGSRLVDLDVLDVGGSMELLEHIVGAERIAAEREAAAGIAWLCGFLPLALRIAAVRLATRPQLPLRRFRAALADERRRLDELTTGDLAVRASLSLSYHGLSAPTRRLLRMLSLLGLIDFAEWVPAALLNVSMDEAETSLDTLVDAQLLSISGVERTGRLRYRLHDLVRVFAREQAEGEVLSATPTR